MGAHARAGLLRPSAAWMVVGLTLLSGCEQTDTLTAPRIDPPPPSYIYVPPTCDGSYTHSIGHYYLTQEQCDAVVAVLAIMQFTNNSTCHAMYEDIQFRYESSWLRYDPYGTAWGGYYQGWPYTILHPLAFNSGDEEIGKTLWHEEAHHRFGDDQETADEWMNTCAATVTWN